MKMTSSEKGKEAQKKSQFYHRKHKREATSATEGQATVTSKELENLRLTSSEEQGFKFNFGPECCDSTNDDGEPATEAGAQTSTATNSSQHVKQSFRMTSSQNDFRFNFAPSS